MFDNILVPLGDSPHTVMALDNACQIGKIFGSKINCLYISDMETLSSSMMIPIPEPGLMSTVDPLYCESGVMNWAEQNLEREEKMALEYYGSCKEKYPDLNINLEKTEGIIWKEILKREKNNDLVVMGKSVHDEDEELFLVGDHFRQVIHKSEVPVLACTKNNPVGTNIMACYDGKKASAKALNLACDVAKKFNSPLTILTIHYNVEKAEIRNKEAVEIAKNRGVANILPVVDTLNTIGTILAEVHRRGIDFLFMGAYGDNPIKDLILGSTTDGVVKQTGCPILLCR